MALEVKVTDNAQVLEFSGAITIYQSAALKDQIERISVMCSSIVLDFSQVDEMDLAGVQLLLQMLHKSRQYGYSSPDVRLSVTVGSVFELLELQSEWQWPMPAGQPSMSCDVEVWQ